MGFTELNVNTLSSQARSTATEIRAIVKRLLLSSFKSKNTLLSNSTFLLPYASHEIVASGWRRRSLNLGENVLAIEFSGSGFKYT